MNSRTTHQKTIGTSFRRHEKEQTKHTTEQEAAKDGLRWILLQYVQGEKGLDIRTDGQGFRILGGDSWMFIGISGP